MDEKKQYVEWKYTGWLGTISLGLLCIVFSTAIAVYIWVESLPYGGLGVNFLTGLLVMGVWLPLLVTAFFIGGAAISSNKGRKQGIVTVSIIGGLFAITMVLSSLAT